MTKCTKCNQEVYLSIGGDTCYHCFVTNSSAAAAAAVATTNNTTATTTIIDKDTKEKTIIKVQFFEDISLLMIQNRMNKFFEIENISNILKIEYVKDKDSRYSVMVVYC